MPIPSFQLIAFASDMCAGKQGAAEGAKELYEYCAKHSLFKETPIFLSTQKPVTEADFPAAKYIRTFTKWAKEKISPTIAAICASGKIPFVLSGDHANAIGVGAGLQQAFPQEKIGIIWIDAHSDIHSPYTTPSGNLHGMSLAALCREDNKTHARQTPPALAQAGWETLKYLVPSVPAISFQHIAFLGLRSFETHEITLIKKQGIHVCTVEHLRKIGIPKAMDTLKAYFKPVTRLYITFDVDVLDADIFKATGTPEPQGLRMEEAKEVLSHVLHFPHLSIFEITEFAPPLDPPTAPLLYPLLDHILQELTPSD